MIEKIKLALRISGDAYDIEIKDLVGACLADLRLPGVTANEDDALIIRAVVLYCKAYFGYNADSGQYKAAYDNLKGALCLAGEYIGRADNTG